MTLYKHFTYVKPENWQWPNFSPSEIACKGTGELLVHAHSMDCLQRLRYFVKAPVIINSAYRSDKHNKAVGGSPNSQHRTGRAFDIRITPSLPREKIHEMARKAGFKAIGDYNTFVHIDTRLSPAYWDLRK